MKCVAPLAAELSLSGIRGSKEMCRDVPLKLLLGWHLSIKRSDTLRRLFVRPLPNPRGSCSGPYISQQDSFRRKTMVDSRDRKGEGPAARVSNRGQF